MAPVDPAAAKMGGRMRTLLIAAALATGLTPAGAQLALKDLTLGADFRKVVTRNALSCRTISGMQYCSSKGAARPESLRTIAGVEATSVVIGPDDDGKLGFVSFTFKAAAFDQVRSALVSRYPGIRCKDSFVQNQITASFEQTECLHDHEGGDLELKRRSTSVDEGVVAIRSGSYYAAMKRRGDERKGAARKDS